jgi:aerobic-type carbon monoxide dehydrogenase small subunit (CoxS/CutS family)
MIDGVSVCFYQEKRGLRVTKISLTVNTQKITVDVDPTTPLLWVLRDVLSLKGTKFGCGIAQCGACTVHLENKAIRSCSVPIAAAEEKNVVTIEGLSEKGDHPLQQSWAALNVPQCGYCQAGQLMSAAALLKEKPQPTDEDIDQAMSGNICRCGTYPRIRAGIHMAAKSKGGN